MKDVIGVLLNQYTDELMLGKPVNIDKYLQQCPEEDRSELKELLATVNLFSREAVTVPVREDKVQEVFASWEKVRLARATKPEKMVANFRSDDLTDDEKEIFKRRRLEILKEDSKEED